MSAASSDGLTASLGGPADRARRPIPWPDANVATGALQPFGSSNVLRPGDLRRPGAGHEDFPRTLVRALRREQPEAGGEADPAQGERRAVAGESQLERRGIGDSQVDAPAIDRHLESRTAGPASEPPSPGSPPSAAPAAERSLPPSPSSTPASGRSSSGAKHLTAVHVEASPHRARMLLGPMQSGSRRASHPCSTTALPFPRVTDREPPKCAARRARSPAAPCPNPACRRRPARRW